MVPPVLRPSPTHAVSGTLAIACFFMAIILHAATWWRAAVWYPSLPDPFPTHFDGAGVPDAWTAKSVGAWFMLPGIGVAMLCLLAGIGAGLAWMARHAPTLLNVPGKDRFVALPPECRVGVLGPTRAYLAWTVMLLSGLFLLLVEGTARVACGVMAVLPVWPLLLVVSLIVAGLVPYWRATMRAIDLAAA
jgi:hypothetical protein